MKQVRKSAFVRNRIMESRISIRCEITELVELYQSCCREGVYLNIFLIKFNLIKVRIFHIRDTRNISLTKKFFILVCFYYSDGVETIANHSTIIQESWEASIFENDFHKTLPILTVANFEYFLVKDLFRSLLLNLMNKNF